MAKPKSKGATAKVVALSPEEFKKLTPDQQTEYLNAIAKQNSELQSANEDLKSKVKESEKAELPTFDVEADEKNDIEGGTYQFTCPTFHWDDNRIIDVRELMAETESDDAKVAEAAQAILGHLVARKSGIIARKED